MCIDRKSAFCPLFGAASAISLDNLSTHESLMKCCRLQEHNSQKAKLSKETVEKVAKEIEVVWAKASISTISRKRVVARIKACHIKYRSIFKPYKQRKDNESYKKRFEKFKSEAS